MTAPARPRTVAEIASRLCIRAVEFRATQPQENTDGRTLEGYAAVFDTPTGIDSWEGSFQEQIARGAFRRTLNTGRMPVLQFDHGRDARTGSVPIGAIQTLREDKTGLFVSARLFDNPVVEPIRQAIEGRAIDGMSFRFRVIKDSWADSKGKAVTGSELLDLLWEPGERGPLTRTIQDVDLLELGPVVFPAYAETSVGVRDALASLGPDARQHLISELLTMLRPEPEPETVRSEESDDEDEPPDDPDNQTRETPPEEGLSHAQPEEASGDEPCEPADSGTSAPTEPANRTSVYLGENQDWFLPSPAPYMIGEI